ncbi:hypothetical protein K6V90_09345 [Cupriavidus pauculus]|uniref:hypothetical protein n=1 Tax=Cupriavidus pauculus TaxID=82633 RepID=UPI001C93317A|nr:hypothetical protein [Cupriavidus pauculus]MBY4730735.1 hypothetical protein [Cupriavidus pauculus]
MSFSLLPEPKQSYEDSNGRPLNGGQLFTYAAGTTTPKVTYQDAAGTTPNTNPIILNERGEAIVYGSGNYRVVLKNAFGATIWDRDNVATAVSATDLSGSNGASFIGVDDTTLDQYIKNRLNRVVNTISDLRALDKTKYTRAFVLGYYAPGDGGGGDYFYDSADTTTADNGGSVIVATDSGRWKLQDTTRLSVRQFGAKGDNTTDDTAAIQKCFNAVLNGGTMYIPAAPGMAYLISKQGSNSYCLDFSRFVHIKAEGFFSALRPATGTTVNTIYMAPVVNGGYWGLVWDGLSLGNPLDGTLAGNNAIFIDTQIAGSQLPGATFRNLNIQKPTVGGAYGILHINSATNNVNGGMYATTFCDSIIKNGINLQASGDSIHIERNLISGDGIAVNAGLVSGASELTIVGNNLTTNGGQIVISAGARFHIINNNIEQQVATTGGTVMVNISASSGTIVNGEIRGNHMGAFTGSNMVANVLIGANCQGTTIDGNTFLNSNVGFSGPAINDGGTQTRIGFNQYGTNLTTLVNPIGPGCMGAAKNLTLQNGWVTFNAGKAPYVFKDANGMVHITGIIASGTVTANTTLFQLPDSNFYPQQLIRFAVPSNNGSAAVHGEIQIDASGVCTIQTGGSPYLGVTVSYPAANAGVIASNL